MADQMLTIENAAAVGRIGQSWQLSLDEAASGCEGLSELAAGTIRETGHVISYFVGGKT